MTMVNRKFRDRLLGAVALCAVPMVQPALAQATARLTLNFEGQELAGALKEVARQAGRQIVFRASIVEGKRAPRLHGAYTPEEAVRALLAGTGLVAEFTEEAILIRGRAEAQGDAAQSPAVVSEVVVTGTRLAGTPVASTVIAVSRRQMEEAGQTNLTDVILSIPQNFGGGQSPGLGFGVPLASGENIGASSSINLRGLGQDATLTLVNGHRLAYGGYKQSIDVSSIPLVAVERIEILPDGASAIYGSDAVAGVANIILRRQFTGVQAMATLAASTDGGNAQQLHAGIAGTEWKSGGLTAAYEFGRNTAIVARQRSYTALTNAGLTLYPALSHHNMLLTGHQDLLPDLTIAIDALANWRTSRSAYSLDGLPASARFELASRHFALSLAPSAEWRLTSRWTLTFAGTYGRDRVESDTDQVLDGTVTPQIRACFCNAAWSAEAGITGTPFDLPGGAVRIAAGAGTRSNTLRALRTVGGARNVNVSQEARYAFGEIGIPVVGPTQELGFLNRLSVTAALRYEDYPGIDRVTTPKLGLILEPIAGLQLRGSWGRSFKAPTLFQLYGDQGVSLRRASSAGGTAYPAAATVLLRSGGNPNLTPERATTWSTSLVARPSGVPGLRVEAGYFHVDYRNRIVLPIAFLSQALTNPIYAEFVQLAPSTTQQEVALDGRTLLNLAGAAYDPAKVVAIVQFGNTNAAAQVVKGIDLLASYDRPVGTDSSFSLTANVSYLTSTQKLSSQQPTRPLAGILYNPPHWRARGGGVWRTGGTTGALHVNYTGGVSDTRVTPELTIKGMTTVDLALSHEIGRETSILRGLTLRLSAQNFLNAKPDPIQTSLVYTPAYDSTNYSPFGRVVSFSLSKRW